MFEAVQSITTPQPTRYHGYPSTMSQAKVTDLLKDFELEFLPAWAQKSNDAKPYADYAGEERPDGGIFFVGAEWEKASVGESSVDFINRIRD